MIPDNRTEPESDRVARALRDQIINGTRPGGSKLVERDLAADLGVSRVPVREALRQLVTEGLVVPRPRSWAVVRTFSDADVVDFADVALCLEVFAFTRAADARTADQLTRLEEVHHRQVEATRVGDVVAVRECAVKFHAIVVEMSGSILLGDIATLLFSRVRWLLGQVTDLETMAAQHGVLLRAVAERDVESIETNVRAYLQTGVEAARARARENPQTADGRDAISL